MAKSCGMCPLPIEEGDEAGIYRDYGLCHRDCIDMAENGPGDTQLDDWALSHGAEWERLYEEKRRLG